MSILNHLIYLASVYNISEAFVALGAVSFFTVHKFTCGIVFSCLCYDNHSLSAQLCPLPKMHKREILPNLLTFYLLVNAPNVVLHELEILRDVQAADQANQTKSVATKQELLKSNGPLISISYFKE